MQYPGRRRASRLRIAAAPDHSPRVVNGLVARSRAFLSPLGGLIVLIVGGISCSGGDSSPTAPALSVSSITLAGAPSDAVLLVGQNTTLVATPRDASGAALSGRVLLWTSSSDAIATVSQSGVVTPIAVGAVTIRASVEGRTGSADVNVRVGLPTPGAGAASAVATTVLGGAVTISIPPGAVAAGTMLNVAPAGAASIPASSQLLANTAFLFGPEGTTFATPVTLTLQFDPASVTASERAGLAIYLATNGGWEEVPGSVVAAGSNTVSVQLSRLSVYALLKRPPAASATVDAAGNNQSAVAGSAVAVKPSVTVLDALGRGLPFASVQFAVASGGGSITGASQTTNASGVATVGSWTLGPTVGANTLTVTVTGLAAPLTVTATGIAGAANGVALIAGNNQSATAGTAVATAPAVKVTDANGNAVGGVSVTFAVGSGGGSVSGATQVTNASGLATVGGWTLGPTVGTNTLVATAAGLGGSAVTVTATGVVGAASAMTINAGNNQTTTAGTAVATAPSVIVKDANGNPVSGVSVTFAVGSGGGSLTGGTQLSNAGGVATVGSWTLGPSAGTNSLVATAAGLAGSPVTVTASGVAGAASAAAINAGNNQSATVGAAVAIAPSVKVTDANGNAVSGVTVTFTVASGGGSVTAATQLSNAGGVATVGSWTLGGPAGTNTLTATAAGVGGSPVSFTATGVVGPASAITIRAGNNQSATMASAVTIPPSVVVKDAHNNVVSGVSVTFAVASGGGALTGASQVTSASGIATVGSWTMGSTLGANTLTATAAGISGGTVTFAATATGFAVLSAAVNEHSCALTGAGLAYCWGSNPDGNVGDGTTINRARPTAVIGGLAFASLAAGGDHACGLTNAGTAYCWGYNGNGELGDGTTTSRSSPVRALGGLTFASLVSGGTHTCGLTVGGAAYCWGLNSTGALGDGTGVNSKTPVAVVGGVAFASLTASGPHTCGLTNGGVAYCWGYNGNGAIGDGTVVTPRLAPTAVTGGLTFASLTAGGDHTCGLTAGGVSYCWGFNGNGELGDASTTTRPAPVAVAGGLTFTRLAAGGFHNTCGITSGGVAYCWGRNSLGQLGDGSITDRTTPTAVSGGLTFADVSVGGFHTCGRTVAGASYCWGYNASGAVGDGTTVDRTAPVAVMFP